eukprot:115617-Pyramimonas_sp.AAC.1
MTAAAAVAAMQRCLDGVVSMLSTSWRYVMAVTAVAPLAHPAGRTLISQIIGSTLRARCTGP